MCSNGNALRFHPFSMTQNENPIQHLLPQSTDLFFSEIQLQMRPAIHNLLLAKSHTLLNALQTGRHPGRP